MYADDPTLSTSAEDPCDLEHKMNYDMNLIQSWLSANKATDCVDGNGLKLEKIGQFFEVCLLVSY